MIEVEGGSRAAAPKDSMTCGIGYAFTHIRNFFRLHFLQAIGIWAEIEALGWYLGLTAGIWVSGLRVGSQGWEMDLRAGKRVLGLGFVPRGWDLSPEAGI